MSALVSGCLVFIDSAKADDSGSAITSTRPASGSVIRLYLPDGSLVRFYSSSSRLTVEQLRSAVAAEVGLSTTAAEEFSIAEEASPGLNLRYPPPHELVRTSEVRLCFVRSSWIRGGVADVEARNSAAVHRLAFQETMLTLGERSRLPYSLEQAALIGALLLIHDAGLIRASVFINSAGAESIVDGDLLPHLMPSHLADALVSRTECRARMANLLLTYARAFIEASGDISAEGERLDSQPSATLQLWLQRSIVETVREWIPSWGAATFEVAFADPSSAEVLAATVAVAADGLHIWNVDRDQTGRSNAGELRRVEPPLVVKFLPFSIVGEIELIVATDANDEVNASVKLRFVCRTVGNESKSVKFIELIGRPEDLETIQTLSKRHIHRLCVAETRKVNSDQGAKGRGSEESADPYNNSGKTVGKDILLNSGRGEGCGSVEVGTLRVRALYEFEVEEENGSDKLALRRGDIITVLRGEIGDDSPWWLGERQSRESSSVGSDDGNPGERVVGWFPPTFVEPISITPNDALTKRENTESEMDGGSTEMAPEKNFPRKTLWGDAWNNVNELSEDVSIQPVQLPFDQFARSQLSVSCAEPAIARSGVNSGNRIAPLEALLQRVTELARPLMPAWLSAKLSVDADGDENWMRSYVLRRAVVLPDLSHSFGGENAYIQRCPHPLSLNDRAKARADAVAMAVEIVRRNPNDIFESDVTITKYDHIATSASKNPPHSHSKDSLNARADRAFAFARVDDDNVTQVVANSAAKSLQPKPKSMVGFAQRGSYFDRSSSLPRNASRRSRYSAVRIPPPPPRAPWEGGQKYLSQKSSTVASTEVNSNAVSTAQTMNHDHGRSRVGSDASAATDGTFVETHSRSNSNIGVLNAANFGVAASSLQAFPGSITSTDTRPHLSAERRARAYERGTTSNESDGRPEALSGVVIEEESEDMDSDDSPTSRPDQKSDKRSPQRTRPPSLSLSARSEDFGRLKRPPSFLNVQGTPHGSVLLTRRRRGQSVDVNAMVASAVARQRDAHEDELEELRVMFAKERDDAVSEAKEDMKTQLSLAVAAAKRADAAERTIALQKARARAVRERHAAVKKAVDDALGKARRESEKRLVTALATQKLKITAAFAKSAAAAQADADEAMRAAAVEHERNLANALSASEKERAELVAANCERSVREAEARMGKLLETRLAAEAAKAEAEIREAVEFTRSEAAAELRAERAAHAAQLAEQVERESKAAEESISALQRDYEANFVPLDEHTAKVEALSAKLQFTEETAQRKVLEAKVKFERELTDRLKKAAAEHTVKLREALASARANDEAARQAKALAETAEDNPEVQRYKLLYAKEAKRRRELYNKLLELRGNIRIFCRVRPLLSHEQCGGPEDRSAVRFPNDIDALEVTDRLQSSHVYEFDRVYSESFSQSAVFEEVKPLIQSALDGYNVCIFAYGQTGSGKTYTMDGSGDDSDPKGRGINFRALEELFNLARERAEQTTITLDVSLYEIYNEQVFDLLVSKPDVDEDIDGGGRTSLRRRGLDVRFDGKRCIVKGLTRVRVDRTEQVLETMRTGSNNRSVACHDINAHSSRSHLIMTVSARCKDNTSHTTTFGKLHLIDLAGSERVGKTGATGQVLSEATAINRSLSALGDVIGALGQGKGRHVPFRNSKLTFLLQDSLSGDSKVAMFVNISPVLWNTPETLCSLNFATKCRGVELGRATRNVATANTHNSADVEPRALPSGGDSSHQSSRARRRSIKR